MDIRIIEAVDILPVTKVDATSIIPLVLVVTGRGFSRAQKAYVNGISLDVLSAGDTTSFGMQVLSDTQVRLRPPESLWGAVLHSVTIVGESIVSLRETTDVTFVFRAFRPVSGISKAFQQFLKLLLTSPGTDLFNPDSGGGLGRPAGVLIKPENEQGMATRVHVAVKKCVQDMRRAQQGIQISPEEKLLDVKVLGVFFNQANLELQIRMEFQTQSGAALVSVGV